MPGKGIWGEGEYAGERLDELQGFVVASHGPDRRPLMVAVLCNGEVHTVSMCDQHSFTEYTWAATQLMTAKPSHEVRPPGEGEENRA